MSLALRHAPPGEEGDQSNDEENDDPYDDDNVRTLEYLVNASWLAFPFGMRGEEWAARDTGSHNAQKRRKNDCLPGRYTACIEGANCIKPLL